MFEGSGTNIEKEMGELEKIRQERYKPTHPDAPIKRLADLEYKIDQDYGKGKVEKKFL